MSDRKQNWLQRTFINKDYGLLFIGRLVSQIGDGIHYFAMAWLVLDITGSGTALGTLLLASAIPGVILAPFSGVLADLWDRKLIVVSMDVVRGLLMLLLAIVYWFDLLTIPLLYVVTLLLSICGVLFGPAISATIPNLVKKEELVRANARDSFSWSATGILGPIVGALLLGTTGYLGIFILNGISFLLSALSETFISFPKHQTRTSPNEPMQQQFIANFRAGLAYIWANKGLRSIIFFGVILNFTMNPLFSVVFPFFGKEVLLMEPEHYGFVQASFPAGMLIGTMLVGYLTTKIAKFNLLVLGITVQGLVICGLGLYALPQIYMQLNPMWLLAGFALPILFVGIANVQVNVPFHVLLQETVPDEYRGRVFGMLGSLLQMLTPISMALYGLGVDILPSSFFFWLAGLAFVAIGFGMHASVSLRSLYPAESSAESAS